MVNKIKTRFLAKKINAFFSASLDEKINSHDYCKLSLFWSITVRIIKGISEIVDSMPWILLVRLITSWVKARKSGEILIRTEKNTAIHLKGYSASETERLLKLTINLETIHNKNTAGIQPEK